MEQGLFYGCRATAIRRTEQNRTEQKDKSREDGRKGNKKAT